MNETTKAKHEEIEEKGTLEDFRKLVNSGEFEKKYETAYVIEDIDLGAREKDGIWAGENWIPIGTSSIPFIGTFDGNGNKIKGLYINKEEDSQALFGYNKGTIKNLGIEASYINANKVVASLVVKNYKDGKIENCHNNAIITGTDYLAGIVAINLGNIENCYHQGSISRRTDGWNYGGIVAGNEGVVSSCYNKGEIYGNYSTGAIVGTNRKTGIVTNSYNIVDLNFIGTTGYSKGGIVGGNSGTVVYCYNLGNIFANQSKIGGIVGENASGASIIQCYNKGNIDNSSYGTGGITGNNFGNIQYCFNTGEISKSKSGDDYIGGIIGGNDGGSLSYCYNIGKVASNTKRYYGAIVGQAKEGSMIENCYYLEGLYADENGIEKTEEEMKSENFIQLLNEKETNFEMDISNKNKGFPILIFE